MRRSESWQGWRVRHLQEEERKRALDTLNDIQYVVFENCISNYRQGRMDEFWNDVNNLDTLFTLSSKILDEDLNDSSCESIIQN